MYRTIVGLEKALRAAFRADIIEDDNQFADRVRFCLLWLNTVILSV